MTYTETLDYLYSKLPMFHRIGPAALKPDLTNTIALCKAIGNPEQKFITVHIAGTNGKGSVSHFLASILQEAGYKTGLYTSPHLLDFRERIKINGEMIAKQAVADFIANQVSLIDGIQPSFFEVTVAMAFDYFAAQNVDIAVIETGLGGRLDSTNVITPLLSVITNISYDHQSLLGNSLGEIAVEKAGIIKENVPVVIGKTDEETDEVFMSKAQAMHSDLFFAEQNFECIDLNLENGLFEADFIDINEDTIYDISSPLPGLYQLENIKTVLQSAVVLTDKGLKIEHENIIEGINKVKSNTGLMGRWEILGHNPLIICDVAHNEAGLKSAFLQIEDIPHHKLRIVYGMVQDKDIFKAISLLPKNAIYYFSAPNLPRALAVHELNDLAKAAGLSGNPFPTVKEAYEKAVNDAGKEDLVLVIGSVFVAAEVLSM